MLEQEYLELVNQLKTKFDDLEKADKIKKKKAK